VSGFWIHAILIGMISCNLVPMSPTVIINRRRKGLVRNAFIALLLEESPDVLQSFGSVFKFFVRRELYSVKVARLANASMAAPERSSSAGCATDALAYPEEGAVYPCMCLSGGWQLQSEFLKHSKSALQELFCSNGGRHCGRSQWHLAYTVWSF
jgi:hypothetical protein